MAVQQPENAVTFMRRAAENSPALFLSAGDIYLSNNDAVTSRQMFGHAKKAFQKSVQKNPHDLQQRVLLARAHVKLGEISEAEETLKAGVRMDPTPEFKRALAEFYVLRHISLFVMGRNSTLNSLHCNRRCRTTPSIFQLTSD